MIPLEKQVTSLEPSKRLKELGIKQDSLFAWYQYSGSVYCEYREHQAFCDAQSTYQDGYAKLPVEICVTFTVAELGEKLKDWWLGSNFCPLPLFDKQIRKWNNHYADDFIAETEADARAKMLIYLIENELMEANE